MVLRRSRNTAKKAPCPGIRNRISGFLTDLLRSGLVHEIHTSLVIDCTLMLHEEEPNNLVSHIRVFLKKDLEQNVKSSDAVFFWLQTGLNCLLLARWGREMLLPLTLPFLVAFLLSPLHT